jgi:hypothetical protein
MSFLESHVDIQRSAFHKWEAAGRPSGDGVNFWLEAEHDLAVHPIAEQTNEPFVGRDERQSNGGLETQAAEDNARALNASVDSHYRDNNRMFQQHGDRGHRKGSNND